jgi:hypothetical protein
MWPFFHMFSHCPPLAGFRVLTRNAAFTLLLLLLLQVPMGNQCWHTYQQHTSAITPVEPRV